MALVFFVVSVLLFIYAYRVWSGNAYYEIQGVPQDENVCHRYYLARGPRAGNPVENPNHSETGLADVSKVRREPSEAGGRSAPSGL